MALKQFICNSWRMPRKQLIILKTNRKWKQEFILYFLYKIIKLDKESFPQ